MKSVKIRAFGNKILTFSTIVLSMMLVACGGLGSSLDPKPDSMVALDEVAGTWESEAGGVLTFTEDGFVEGLAHCDAFMLVDCQHEDLVEISGTWQLCSSDIFETSYTDVKCNPETEGYWIDIDAVSPDARVDLMAFTGDANDRQLYSYNSDFRAESDEFYSKASLLNWSRTCRDHGFHEINALGTVV